MCHRNKKGILVVSFGTTYEDARKLNIEAVENRIRNEFGNYEIRRAFTSNIIINKLKEKENTYVDNPKEALDKMMKENFKEVIIQPLHIIPGIEYEKLFNIYKEYEDKFDKINLGRPVLYNIDSCKEAINALKGQLPKEDDNNIVVLLGHGTTHQSNSYYSLMQNILDEERLNVIVDTIENFSNIDNLIKDLKSKNIYGITLMPYLLVAGNHVKLDIFSDNDDSWKTRFEKEGFKVKTYIHGLGENIEYQNIYINRVKEAILETK